jgi:hypothetical protein
MKGELLKLFPLQGEQGKRCNGKLRSLRPEIVKWIMDDLVRFAGSRPADDGRA